MHRLVLVMTAMTLACGGDDGGDATTNADTSSSASSDDTGSTTDATVDSEGSSAVTLDESSESGSSESSGAPTTGTDSGSTDGSSGTDESTTGGTSELQVDISDATSFMNCQPIVPPDPLNLSFTLDFDNQGAAVTSADVTAARLATGGVEAVSFDLAPSSFGPFDAGETASAATSKVDGSAMPQNGCDTLECGSQYDIEVELDVDGSTALAMGTVTVECAF